MPYKLVLTFINVLSCYWSLFKYAKYFAKRHPKIIEDAKAVEVAMRANEDPYDLDDEKRRLTAANSTRMSHSSLSMYTLDTSRAPSTEPKRLSFVSGTEDCLTPSQRHTTHEAEYPTHPRPVYAYRGYWEGTTEIELGNHAQAFTSHEDLSYPADANNRRKKNSWANSPV
jgi:hypothetical protein